MIKIIFALLCIPLSTLADSVTIPDTPPDACYQGCTPKMQELLTKFNAATTPSLDPAVYSGECYHLSYMYNPNHTHYGVMMFDQDSQNQNKPYFSMIFAFFTDTDEYVSWDLKTARTQMSSDWKSFGRNIILADQTARIEYRDPQGNPSMTYWMRQDLQSKTIYQITYWGTTDISFCEFKKH